MEGVFMSATVYIVAAIAEDNEIGCKNQLLWHIPEDLKRFRSLTEEHPVIMGRKTFESLGSKPLPNRPNIIITSKPEKYQKDGILVASSLEQALKMAKKIDREEVFIIGGAQIYKEAMEHADILLITHVYKKFKEADCHFPKISSRKWKKVKQDEKKVSKSGIEFSYTEYEKIIKE